ncbi:MAG TPA: hypothetical protein VHY22_05500 [Chthoniobacteraceae bacterium]|jgi:hypothetical protein|nr:hypothetical protein [Chthoniobacteraceae bacterium]
MITRKKLTRKERNEHCRSLLQAAIRSIIAASTYWDIKAEGFAACERLRDMKWQVKAQLSHKEEK